MALLQNEDFAIWYLRSSYLASDKDGIGERLINIDSSVLNTPGFRAAGWTVEHVPRTYSPPIPTAITPEYMKQSKDRREEKSPLEEDDEGGLVTGRRSNDTIGPAPHVVRKRRKKEQAEEDDSSELSDESDDEFDGTQRAVQQIRFAKMPSRNRSESFPVRHMKEKYSPEGTKMSPPKPDLERRPRTSSLGAVEAVKARARADTVTSSEMSSDNELDPAYFKRRHVSVVHKVKSNSTTDQDDRTVPEDDEEGEQGGRNQDDSDLESDGSDLSSDLGDTVDSTSILGRIDISDRHISSSPGFGVIGTPDSRSAHAESPRRARIIPPLQTFPSSRPISKIPPVSLLSQALNAQNQGPENPIQLFAALSGKGSPNPLYIKIYLPFSSDPDEPVNMPLLRTSKEGNPVIVAEAIGLALWRYAEEEREPAIPHSKMNINNWTLRMVEDGEVDFDFPALDRRKVITDFTSNNNRGARGRSRERPFDEFALVEATAQQIEANNRETPQFVKKAEPVFRSPEPSPSMPSPSIPASRTAPAKSNVLLAGQPFTSALSNTTLTPADMPAPAGRQATPRMGTTKTIRVRYIDLDVTARSITMEISTDSYIAEILDNVCKRWNLDKAAFFLRVAGTNTMAPVDRTVEVLGARSDLDLVRRRFGAGPAASTGSLQSASPTAPLMLDIQGPSKGKKGHQTLQALAQKQDLASTASNFKKYYVNRKQLKSFAQGGQRVLIFDGDFLLIMPADAGKNHIFDTNVKSSSVAFADIMRCKVSSKHSKLVRLTVRRPTEPKKYDFEARTAGEAQEIVDDILREMKLAKS